ncbi:transcription elongation factor S-II [Scleroderma yunnanense]
MMSEVTELKKLVKDLQSATTVQERVSILQLLKKNFHVNESILRESKAGLAVGKLRAHDSKEVSDLAKEIVKKWKNEVERAKGGSGSKTPSNGKPPARKPSVNVTPVSATPPAVNGKSEVRSAKGDGVKISYTGDATRDRCTELIYDGLACDSGAPTDMIINRAKGVEQAVYALFGSANPEYKGKIRSLFVNLKDKGNPSLRESIVSGELSPEKFSRMTSEEMMSEERRAADQKIKEENLCKQRKCRYRQAQTRSADEPMTLRAFISSHILFSLRCVNCGNRWKFS